jgi:hypothetical protein
VHPAHSWQAGGDAVFVDDVATVEGTVYAAYAKSPRTVGTIGIINVRGP